MRFGTAAAAAAAAACVMLACQGPWKEGERSCADKARLDFPVDLSVYAVKGSLAPFGTHGGASPEGHPGIDFLLDSADAPDGIAVKASFSASIVSITPETDFPGSSCILLDSACIEVNLCHLRLDPALKEGGSVKRGQRLGEVGLVPGANRYSLHFGTYHGRDADLACPSDFLDADSVRCRLGLDDGGKAPPGCGYAPGTVTLMGRSEYAERFSRSMSLKCEDGSVQVFAVAGENALCNPRFSSPDRSRMLACLGNACAGVW
ncbi:MAG: hypothetical protein ABIW76_14805 [Fibrobacteria bacterium]